VLCMFSNAKCEQKMACINNDSACFSTVVELTWWGHALSPLTVADSASYSLSLTALRSSTLLLLPGAAAAAASNLAAKSRIDASFMSFTCSRLTGSSDMQTRHRWYRQHELW
jgi:hypothetical protein